jgi:hypothetical protein
MLKYEYKNYIYDENKKMYRVDRHYVSCDIIFNFSQIYSVLILIYKLK